MKTAWHSSAADYSVLVLLLRSFPCTTELYIKDDLLGRETERRSANRMAILQALGSPQRVGELDELRWLFPQLKVLVVSLELSPPAEIVDKVREELRRLAIVRRLEPSVQTLEAAKIGSDRVDEDVDNELALLSGVQLD